MAVNRPRTMPPSPATTSAATSIAATASHDSHGSTFANLGVPPRLTAVLEAVGITSPFPIQTAALPDALAGRDVLGRGRTGSGKTLAFALPVVARLAENKTARRPGRPRALILAPTRELATQIDATVGQLARALGLRSLTVFGGVGHAPQIRGLRDGVDIVIACPGRLADHLQEGHLTLDAIEITVLDEADHMADLGFLPVVRRLLDKTPKSGQRLLFSATLDAGVDVLVRRYLTNPVTHSVDSAQTPVGLMDHHVLHVGRDARLSVLVDLASAPGRTLLFTRTKHGARTLTRQLVAKGVPAVELHGNLSQNARTRNLTSFSDGGAHTLVATDIAARGIHVDDITLVVHADPPVEHKAYLHRSGRTARAGAAGTVVTLMTDAQVSDVRDLTRKAGIRPTITRICVGDPLLRELAPGERVFVEPPARAAVASTGAGGGGRSRGRRTGGAGGASGSGGGERSGGSSSRRGRGQANSSAARTPRGNRNSGVPAVASGSTSAAGFSASARSGGRGRRR